MKKLIFLIGITGLMVGNVSYASQFINKIANKQSNMSRTIQDKDFTDFSGTWEGSCDSGGALKRLLIQNCQYSITMNALTYEINALTSHTVSNKNGSESTNTQVDWSNNKTTLLFDITATYREESTDFNSKESSMTKASLKLERKDELIFEGIDVFYNNGEIIQEPFACRFKKL